MRRNCMRNLKKRKDPPLAKARGGERLRLQPRLFVGWRDARKTPAKRPQNVRKTHIYEDPPLPIGRGGERLRLKPRLFVGCRGVYSGRRALLPAPALGWGLRAPTAGAFSMRRVFLFLCSACGSRATPSRRRCGGRSVASRGSLSPRACGTRTRRPPSPSLWLGESGGAVAPTVVASRRIF